MNNKYLLSFLTVFLWGNFLFSQIDYDKIPEVTNTILINDVHIQKSPESNFGLGDILIKDGLIVNIAKSIEAPFNAKVIEADSAYAYPAFIDALSHAGISKKESKEDRPKVKFRGFPPNELAGITPERSAHSEINAEDKSIKDLREAGFGIAHSVPRGRMLPGQGTLISLYGDDAESMLLQKQVSQFFQFEGARRLFPATTIAVMSKYRDMYRQAGFMAKHQDAYKQSSIGVKRPKSDKSVMALIPAVKKEVPVFMNTPKVKDIFRALELQKELGFNLVLTDVKQIFPAIDKVKKSGAGIVLSTDLPKKEKESKKKDEDKEVDPEKEALKKRKTESLNRYVGQAYELDSLGMSFSFSMLSGKAKDLKPNLIRMVEAGLSEKAALAALTTNPAKLLKIDKIVGTLDNGKLANIMISNEPYFQKDSKIKYVFVEGHMTELKEEKKKKKGSSTGEAPAVAGVWSYDVEIPGSPQSGKITISGDGDNLTLELVDDSTPDETDTATDVELDGSNLTFGMTVDNGGGSMALEFDIDIEDDAFEGTVTAGPFGSFPISGTKISTPE